MKEEFLHWVWKNRLYYPLKDNDGLDVEIITPGTYNRDSGPDFFNARIRTGGTDWAGNVEIHIRASDFYLHGHQNDHSFDNLILHVVYHNDAIIRDSRGRSIPTVELAFDEEILARYSSMINQPASIACNDHLHHVDRFFIRHWLGAILVERLGGKFAFVRRVLDETSNDWEETFYRIISRYFGFRVNTEPFEMLATALPFKIIRKHIDNGLQLEALLFGTAGMLEEGLFREAVNDTYFLDLSREYRILRAKYSLNPVHGWLWKFSRLRPVNFPTIRISQLSAMLSVTGGLFTRSIEATSLDELRSYFSVAASSYWDDHYIFGKKARGNKKTAGEVSTDILLINSVIPVIFTYGQLRSLPAMKEKALGYLDEIKAEDNIITREWARAGFCPSSAFESQALIHLRDNYCRRRRCLDCRIGSLLISGGNTMKESDQLSLEPPPCDLKTGSC
ncbi:MAG: DUF2851 family protein [Bacteroidales bacterium]